MNMSLIIKSPLSRDALEEWLVVAQVEALNLKENIIDRVVLLKEEKAIRHFVREHHSRLIFLSDLLLHYINSDESNIYLEGVSLKCAQKAIFLVIDDLLNFIWKHYSKYCDLNHKISEKLKQITIKEFTLEVSAIKKSKNYSNHEMVKVALLPLEKIISNENSKISFHLVYYFKELLKEIGNFINSVDHVAEVHSFRKNLVYINLNSLGFADFLISEINHEVDQIEQNVDKIDKLFWFLKMYNQTPVRPSIAYLPKQKSIKDFMIEWLLEEICYLEKKEQLSGNGTAMTITQEKNFKVVTELSVSQVACLIRLLVKTGVIKNKNQKQLIEFYAAYTQSKKQENISFESFRSKFYNIEESSKQDIRDLMIRLLNEIRKL